MAAKKLATAEVLAGGVDDFALGAAGIGDERAGPDERIEVTDCVEDSSNGLREEDDVGLGHGFFDGGAAIDRAHFDGVGDGGFGTDAEDGSVEAGAAECKAEGRADQSGADDGNDEIFGGLAGHTVLPTAGAI